MISRRRMAGGLVSVTALALLLATVGSASAQAPVLLNPRALTKFMDPLPVPGAMPMAGPNHYEIGAYQIQQQLHSQLPPTTVYGYGTSQETASYPGATIVTQKGTPISIKWTNHLPSPHILQFAFDPTIPAAQTTTGIPITTHVHGCEVEPPSDGGPLTWFTPDFAETGHDWKKQVLTYPNTQLPATIWYHDHAFGYTRHNVYAGLAGFFVITDPANEPAGLPSGAYDIGLAIQDRMFQANGQLWYPNVGLNPEHPVWIPEFFGDVMLVNGKVWPYLNVEARKYRFRFLEGCQARFVNLSLSNRLTGAPGPAFYQIGTDGGYLDAPVILNDPANPASPRLLLAPGERADVIIDFSAYAPGTEFILKNNAKAPYPVGAAADPQTTGQVMLFRVVPATSPDNSVLPAALTTVERITNPSVKRVMTLNEMMGAGGPLGMFLNGLAFHDGPVTEMPTLGTTEMWEIVNLTADAHPIHLHLVQFQLLNRQKVDTRKYGAAFTAANPVMPASSYVPVDPTPYLKGKPVPADPNERGWKDTFRMNPGEVTRILIKWAPQDGSPAFAFDATAEPGYVWHCHILEHEENDMMRPFHMMAAPGPAQPAAQRPAVAEPQVSETMLLSPYPNPATRGATMRFSLRNAGRVELDLYDVAGHRVRRLASGSFPAGQHGLNWDGSDDRGRTVASGVYLLSLRADGVSRTMKVSFMP